MPNVAEAQLTNRQLKLRSLSTYAIYGYHTQLMKLMQIMLIIICRVESEDSDKRENAQLIVLFTGISQSVVKNLKQVHPSKY